MKNHFAKKIAISLSTMALILMTNLEVIAKPLSGEIHVNVKGMVCAFCVNGIKKSFSKLNEVKSVDVSLEKKFVHLSLKDGQTLDSDQILKILEEAGYEGQIGH